jgi:hypothetical protein
MHTDVDHDLGLRTEDLIGESEKAIREGNRERAYQLILQVIQIAPDNIDAWLSCVTLAPSLAERVFCVNHLNELAPGYQDRHDIAFFALKELFDEKPYLAYLAETDELYRVINTDRVVLNIPKKRARFEPYPPVQPTAGPLRLAYRWLILSMVGLLVAGIGTVVFAPMAAVAAIRADQSPGTRAERGKATVVFLVSVGLFMIGVIFLILFVLHWAS